MSIKTWELSTEMLRAAEALELQNLDRFFPVSAHTLAFPDMSDKENSQHHMLSWQPLGIRRADQTSRKKRPFADQGKRLTRTLEGKGLPRQQAKEEATTLFTVICASVGCINWGPKYFCMNANVSAYSSIREKGDLPLLEVCQRLWRQADIKYVGHGPAAHRASRH